MLKYMLFYKVIGFDGFVVRILKIVVFVIFLLLSWLINYCIDIGIFFLVWEIVKVMFIYKGWRGKDDGLIIVRFGLWWN